MGLRLRQIAIVASDLRDAAEQIGSVLGLEACYIDPGVRIFGLKNTLWPVGSQFLEVVTPTGPGTAAGRYLDRRGGDGGYMVITQCDDVEARRARAEALGIRIAFELRDPEGTHDGIQLHPGDTGGALLEMDQMFGADGQRFDGPWYPAGPYWEPYVRTDRVSSIAAAELQSPDPDRLASRWSEITEIDLAADADGHPVLPLENALVRFVAATDGRGEGLGGIDVATTDRDAVAESAERAGVLVDEDTAMIAGLRVGFA